MTRKRISQILENDPHLTDFLDWKESEWTDTLTLDTKQVTAIRQRIENTTFKRQLYEESLTYPFITIFDKSYPQSLRHIPDPPLVIYYLGNPSLFQTSPNLSVVGTRYPSMEATRVMKKLLTPIVRSKWCIVSGMAKGVDSMAHKIAIDEGHTTIAVLGSGFQHVYPKENTSLFHQLSTNHLVLSEYPPHTKPEKYYFPERNRIISGLGFATLVIEAKQKSGTMITVDQALDQGKEVFAVPGSILAKTSEGCHQLIKEGAKLITSADDILTEWQQTIRKS